MVFRHREYKPEDDVRETPLSYFEKLDRDFTIDACALLANTKCRLFYAPDGLWHVQDGQAPARISSDVSGLTGRYDDHDVWCNPPFSLLAEWIEKAWLSSEANSWTLLMPGTRADRPFWHELVEPYRDGRGPRPGSPASWRLTTHYDPFRIDFLEDGHAVYQKDKAGKVLHFKSGPKKGLPKPSTAMFGCVRLEWRHV